MRSQTSTDRPHKRIESKRAEADLPKSSATKLAKTDGSNICNLVTTYVVDPNSTKVVPAVTDADVNSQHEKPTLKRRESREKINTACDELVSDTRQIVRLYRMSSNKEIFQKSLEGRGKSSTRMEEDHEVNLMNDDDQRD